MTSLANKLQNLEMCLKSQHGQEAGCGCALREAILGMDYFTEVEVLKSLGDLRLEKAKLSKDSAEFDQAAALYAAALLRCKEQDVGETLDHRIGYMEKLSRQLLQGYSPHFRWLSPDYWGTAESNVLRVAEICDKLHNKIRKSQDSIEQVYTETLVTAIENSDMFLEVEVLKSLGDFYLKKGKKTSDVPQFSKAAAMYNKALTTCVDPETKLTLEHRIAYTDKVWGLVEKARQNKKSRPTERRPHKGHKAGDIKRTDITRAQDQHRHPDRLRKAKGIQMTSVATGTVAAEERHTDFRADLDSAEKHFAAALKTVHVRDPTAQQYKREVEPLCRLGEVYIKRGQQTGDGGDFVKAVAFYNAVMARTGDDLLNGMFETVTIDFEKSFLKCVLDIDYDVSQDNKGKQHKKQLQEMRDQIKLEMETIDQQLDPYVHDEDDPCVKEIEAKRGQAVRQLFEKIAQQRKEFISLLVEECIGLMGPPPCKYALMGLGSQATGLVTPYSDLEFAILVEEESEECLVYFHNLTHYLHLKVVNLGETILPALGIKSLNDFYSGDPLDDWYYDSVTPRGFAFDASMPKASKTPLGRQGTMNEPPSELICTPKNMVSILQKDVTLYLKEGYHLATILRNPCLIAGDQDLIDTYMAITVKILQADGGKMAEKLAQETLRENSKSYTDKGTITAKLIDVKKQIYRFPAVAMDCLALSSGIIPTTVWETIEEMESQQVISPNNAHHLTVLTSISAELRLKTYMANSGQRENLSALASMETAQQGQESSILTNDEVQTNMMKPVFHLPNEKQLFRYYYTTVPLKSVLSSEKKTNLNSSSELYDNSPEVCGEMCIAVCKNRMAINYYVEALKKAEHKDTKKVDFLRTLGIIWMMMGDYQKSINYSKEALQACRSIYGQSVEHPDVATLLNNLGLAWHKVGNTRKAVSYNEQALQMFRNIYGQRTAHTDIATSLHSLGSDWDELGDYRNAVSYYEQALQMYRSICAPSTEHPLIAVSLTGLGGAWSHLGDHRKAISYHEQALQMHRSIYGNSTAHPLLAVSLNNLGTAWGDLGDNRKAISCHEQALQMCRSIYGPTTTHLDIVSSLNNLGVAWSNLGDNRKAISYHEQALQIQSSIYGHNTAHRNIATTLNNLGLAWDNLGVYEKAISYYGLALRMRRAIYGKSTDHPSIADSLNSLGTAWYGLGDHRKAITYYEQALQMYRSVYGKIKAHPDIATSLNNLGAAWDKLDDFKKAISHHEQALQMRRTIFGETTAHPAIANSSFNLAWAWYEAGDNKKALCLCEQAVAMARKVYHQDKSHPLLETYESHLTLIN
ncbi:hypothetical protein Bbelb_336480 [Branchiostoma belcheri]|nr:hypothetical protein Bbelb_336480 [Branchiostoma belcheri]